MGTQSYGPVSNRVAELPGRLLKGLVAMLRFCHLEEDSLISKEFFILRFQLRKASCFRNLEKGLTAQSLSATAVLSPQTSLDHLARPHRHLQVLSSAYDLRYFVPHIIDKLCKQRLGCQDINRYKNLEEYRRQV